jgi:8-oxo-dGTP pyrophosphatase MutT (NUDIX family)
MTVNSENFSNSNKSFAIFDSLDCKIDMKLPYFERGIAVIKLLESDKFVVYDRNSDKLWRFCGGHIEKNEKPEFAAKRETQEEIALDGLKFLNYINTCHKFLLYQNKPSHILEHYFLFEVSDFFWQKRRKPEPNLKAHLKTKLEINQNNWNQVNWILEQV